MSLPFYDHLLVEDEVEDFLPILKKQNLFLNITELHCFMEKEDTPGWEAYYKILTKFAEEEVKIRFHIYEQ